jgi:hypothetical protein
VIGRYGCTATGWPSRVSRSPGARGACGLAVEPDQAALRNWVEERYPVDGTGFGSGRGTESAEHRALKNRAAGPERTNEILETSYNTRRLQLIDRLPPTG